jgi:hypothetical protein
MGGINWGKTHTGSQAEKKDQTRKMIGLVTNFESVDVRNVRSVISLKSGSSLTYGWCFVPLCMFINVYFFFIMFMNPKIFKNTRFNSYLTEYQTELLSRLARERNCSKTELLREALHYFLRKNGLDDELIYDQKDHEKQMAKIFPWWRNEEEGDYTDYTG